MPVLSRLHAHFYDGKVELFKILLFSAFALCPRFYLFTKWTLTFLMYAVPLGLVVLIFLLGWKSIKKLGGLAGETGDFILTILAVITFISVVAATLTYPYYPEKISDNMPEAKGVIYCQRYRDSPRQASSRYLFRCYLSPDGNKNHSSGQIKFAFTPLSYPDIERLNGYYVILRHYNGYVYSLQTVERTVLAPEQVYPLIRERNKDLLFLHFVLTILFLDMALYLFYFYLKCTLCEE